MFFCLRVFFLLLCVLLQRFQSCSLKGSCEVAAVRLIRIHDDDGATVDLVLNPEYSTDRKCVVYKTYETAGSPDSDFSAQVAAEIDLFRRMAGRCHTIPLLDSFRSGSGDHVLVFPFIRSVAITEIRSYLRQLLEALQFLHDEMKMMHRNIKQPNLLWSDDGNLSVIDFEDACTAHPGALYPRVGNNRYRAPEMRCASDGEFFVAAPDGRLSCAARYGYAADIFSAGLVFGELLFGRKHFFLDMDTIDEDYDELSYRLERYPDRRRCFKPWMKAESVVPEWSSHTG